MWIYTPPVGSRMARPKHGEVGGPWPESHNLSTNVALKDPKSYSVPNPAATTAPRWHETDTLGTNSSSKVEVANTLLFKCLTPLPLTLKRTGRRTDGLGRTQATCSSGTRTPGFRGRCSADVSLVHKESPPPAQTSALLDAWSLFPAHSRPFRTVYSRSSFC